MYPQLEGEPAQREEGLPNLNRSSIVRKLLAYDQVWKQQLHREVYKIPSFRVLIVTTSQKRCDAMLAVIKKIYESRKVTPYLFWVTDYATLQAGDIFTRKWRSYTEEKVKND